MKIATKESIFKPFIGNKFSFMCHKDIQCFTICCADLSLILTPYDILRIKNRLGISSDDFLDKYTDTKFDNHPRFPMINLKMKQGEKRECPFVSPNGCTIYEDRPGACRIYPLGRAALKVDRERDAREKFFVVHEDHCFGFKEKKQWTIEDWLVNEGVKEYNTMNDQWIDIITSPKGIGPEKDVPRKVQMFYMASYNLDKFRKFILKSKFFELFEIESVLKEKLAFDDDELMKFAFEWLRFSLFGEKTIQIKRGM